MPNGSSPAPIAERAWRPDPPSGQSGRARSFIGLLDGNFASDAAGDEQPVAVERPVA
jgi:hypothetical protein